MNDTDIVIISTAKFIIVSVRGTDANAGPISSFTQWIVSTGAVGLIRLPNRSGVAGKVHSGLATPLLMVDRQVKQQIINFGGMNKKIWIVGHSAGAVKGTILASILAHHDKIPIQGLYVYGGPSSVGDYPFATQANTYFNSNRQFRYLRLEVRYDLVTTLPLDVPPFSYSKSGVRCYHHGLGPRAGYTPARPERTILFDNPGPINSLANLCDHSPDHYCRQAFYLLQRNRALIRRPNVPNLPSNPGTNPGNC
jgi:hypothetical protein